MSRRFVARSSAVRFEALADMDEGLTSLVSALSKRPELAERFLQDEQPAFKSGRAFVTAVVALHGGAVSVFDELVGRLESEPELLPPLASALAWLEYDEVRAQMQRLLDSGVPAVVRLGLVAAVGHLVNPGVTLQRALDSDDPRLRGSALEAIGRLGLGDLRPWLRTALEDGDATCRFWAAWSAARLGDAAGIPVLGRFAAKSGPFARPACDMALRALEPARAIGAHARLVAIPGNDRTSVFAAGVIGDPALAGWLLDQMESPSLARSAGAAFCLMTGRDLRRDDLDAERPPLGEEPDVAPVPGPDAAAQASQNAGDDVPDDEADDGLVWPDTVRLREWWEANRPAFVPGIRYLAGVPIRPPVLATVLRTGNQRQRAAAALELAMRSPDQPLLDVTAPAHRQVSRSAQGI